MKLGRSLAVVAVAIAMTLGGFVVAAAQSSAGPEHPAHPVHPVSPATPHGEPAIHDTMRMLWEEHVVWTRLFIVSDVANLPDLSVTTARLLQNQTDIGNAFKPFFGTQAGDQLTALLRQHILEAADILNAAKANDANAVAASEAAWYANANEIAAFWHSLNPRQWPLDPLQMMMKEHLDLTLDEAVSQLTGNFAKSASDYDAIEQEILGMADTLSNGIVALPGH